MDDLTASQPIEMSFEYLKFCMFVIDKEMKRFNLDFTVYKTSVAELIGTLEVNFDIAYYRCAFMYKYTLCNIYFMKDCMNKFLLEFTEFKNLVSKWSADPNLRLCSLSSGPGLDYLSFVLALSEHISPPVFKSVTVLSKYGAWRNTVGIIADAIEEGAISKQGIGQFRNVDVVQADILASIPVKGIDALKQSNIILMVKSLNLKAPCANEEIIKSKLLELISSLKLETSIFFIDTKPSLTLILEVLSKCPGKFLYEPEHFSFKVPITFSDDYKDKHGSLPVSSSRGAFFVWQKLAVFEGNLNINISTLNSQTDVKEISQNSFTKAYNESDEVLNITKSLKDLIFPNDKNLELNPAIDIASDSCMNDRKQSMSAIPNPINASKPFEINKSSSILGLSANQSVQEENFQFNCDGTINSSHSLRKSTSIDNSFFQSSPNSLSFLGDSGLLQNYSLNTCSIKKNDPSFTEVNTAKKLARLLQDPPLNTCSNKGICSSFSEPNTTKKKASLLQDYRLNTCSYKEIDPTSFSEPNAAEKKACENNNVPKFNQIMKPKLESKATQTELHPSVTNSSPVKDLTERVKQLVSALESEVEKKYSNSQTHHHLGEIPNQSVNHSSCSINCGNNSEVDIKPPCCREVPINCCNHAEINRIHCCSARHIPIHRCEMDCRSCIHRCHAHSYRPCENIASMGTSSTPPQIVIPLQNINNDILLQIIAAAKSN